MTELAYRPDQTPLGSPQQERFVFVDPADRHARQFEVAPQAAVRPIGADSPEVNQALEDAHRAAQQERSDAAARTAEQGATDAELARAIDWNAQTIEVTREYTEHNGF